ncbi:MAG: DUF378 domain-containing protein [Achromobacter sp.]|jgi:uncharacterized membrane protein YuzA (DUF378 family)|uniref:DUF378 domain-containing protein n=1 Tax=Achromobacter insuavis TaxID=1287735 RepID=A0A6J5BR50_9BURK|nr:MULTISPECIES: DUF378 domain-containing protein [Achromobacter]MBN9638613.1 DUF378 domain-containing protein [Achromobacter sp.]CAB3711522.1 hypothetical protein LMG26845_05803 [Achromobacter insuavis]CUJ43757.1 Domain of uncharacterised function (DUF378) [Achromobacter sp. 2789STDY5608628]CUJ78303.1 Domain of uncharacterised function (DUF378) [Achromobacter sp. 2789STDY5608633]CUK18258.1 Domain of uncharacterised function (DUF378) [Achromobacter sp. 2789STDY5608615]
MHSYGDDDELALAADGDVTLRQTDGATGLRPMDWVALVVLVAGGLNSGLIAAVNLDAFARLLPWPMAGRVAYGLVGLAALHCVVLLFRLAAEER